MSSRATTSLSQSPVSSAKSAYSCHCTSSTSSDMTYGTHSLKREEAGLSTNEGHRLPWAKEIECKINVFNEPVQHFFKVFVPGSGPSKQLSTKIMKDALKKVDFRGRPGDKYTALVSRVCV